MVRVLAPYVLLIGKMSTDSISTGPSRMRAASYFGMAWTLSGPCTRKWHTLWTIKNSSHKTKSILHMHWCWTRIFHPSGQNMTTDTSLCRGNVFMSLSIRGNNCNYPYNVHIVTNVMLTPGYCLYLLCIAFGCDLWEYIHEYVTLETNKRGNKIRENKISPCKSDLYTSFQW